MAKVTRPDRVEQFSTAEWPMTQVGMATVRQFWDRGQIIAKMITNWNTEFTHFMGHRINQTSECIGQMAQCRSLPELLEVEGNWVKSVCVLSGPFFGVTPSGDFRRHR